MIFNTSKLSQNFISEMYCIFVCWDIKYMFSILCYYYCSDKQNGKTCLKINEFVVIIEQQMAEVLLTSGPLSY